MIRLITNFKIYYYKKIISLMIPLIFNFIKFKNFNYNIHLFLLILSISQDRTKHLIYSFDIILNFLVTSVSRSFIRPSILKFSYYNFSFAYNTVL